MKDKAKEIAGESLLTDALRNQLRRIEEIEEFNRKTLAMIKAQMAVIEKLSSRIVALEDKPGHPWMRGKAIE